MNNYFALFLDEEYPQFLDKYLETKTLKRLHHVTQFCGCDYTHLYHPKFIYTRLDHSLVVAHMTWHFTHDKKETIAALLHDIGTPCFSHVIDFLLGDSMKQESSERKIVEVIRQDNELLQYLNDDAIMLEDLENFGSYPILENKSPKLCADRLDGVLHTCYIWLQTHTLEEIKEVYDNLTVLVNEEGKIEIGLEDVSIAEKFASMVSTYAKELQSNRNKYVMQFIAKTVKMAIHQDFITLEDLYQKKESELVFLFKQHFSSWSSFEHATRVIGTDVAPNQFYVSITSKKRNVIPLIQINGKMVRITNISNSIKNIYDEIATYQEEPYAYIEMISQIV